MKLDPPAHTCLIASALAGALCFSGCGKSPADSATSQSPAPSGPAAQPEPEPKASPGQVAAPPPLGEDTRALLAQITRESFEADLVLLAKERSLDRAQYQIAQDRCAQVFEAAGFDVSRTPFTWDGGSGVNVIGVREGSDPKADAVVLGAHYDHIDNCAGADDNASGTAAVLEMARVLGPKPTARTLIVACWDEEEDGLIGSKVHAQELTDAGTKVSVAIALDAIANADNTPGAQSLPEGLELIFPAEIAKLKARGFKADFIGALYDHAAATHGQRFGQWAADLGLESMLVDIPQPLRLIDATAQLRRSDHASFWRQDVPAMLINDTANFRTKTYHCWEAADTVESLELDFAFKALQATAATVFDALQIPPAG